VELIGLLRGGYADVEDSTGHAQSMGREYAMVNRTKVWFPALFWSENHFAFRADR